jgi:hypothetical protein
VTWESSFANCRKPVHYLRAARWRIDEIVRRKPTDAGFMFHIVGILASLRAVQHSLINADSKLSPTHKVVITDWLRNTPMSGTEISFIKSSRDLLLKGGAFEAYAGHRQGFFDDAMKFVRTEPVYEVGYYTDGKRRDLIADMRGAADWCDRQLTEIEMKVPHIVRPGDPA